MTRATKSILVAFLLLLLSPKSNAQFYNGLQMGFGKSRVQYNMYEWLYYRFERFDVYYYADGKELAQYTSRYVEKRILDWENYFNTPLRNRVIFIVYNKQSEFKQSNIGLVTGNTDSNVGGKDNILKNKVFLYFDGNHRNFEKQIDERLARIMIHQSLYSGSFAEKVISQTLIDLPEWYMAGLAAYLAEGWTPETEAIIRDRIRKKKFRRLNGLEGEEAKLAGMAIWNSVAKRYGQAIIPSILYMTKAQRDYKDGFNLVTGEDFKKSVKIWLESYKTDAAQDEKGRRDIPTDVVLKRPKSYRVYQRMSISPDGKKLAYVTNNKGKYKIWLHDLKSGKKKKLLRRFHRMQQITDYSMPLLAWHPKSEILTFITEEKGKIWLYFYNIKTKEEKKQYLPKVNKVNSFSYSPNGLKMVMSATMQGRTDIFIYHLPSRNFTAVTEDMADDFDPRFVDGSSKIAFTSNRVSDTLKTEKRPYFWLDDPIGEKTDQTDIFVYDLDKKSDVLSRITSTPNANETQPYPLAKNKYVYLSDQNGIRNKYIAYYDSTISHIDTTVHYRFFSNTNPLTDYARTTFGHSLSKNKVGTALNFENKRFRLYTEKIDLTKALDTTLRLTVQAKHQKQLRQRAQRRRQAELEAKRREQARIDSIRRTVRPPFPDSLLIDVNRYVFENEQLNPYQFSTKVDSLLNLANNDSVSEPRGMNYLRAFYNDYFAGEVDFSFANQFYQPYTGNYFTPGVNFAMKFGTKDLFEDYKFIGAFDLSPDLESYNYLLGFERLKKRVDHMYLFQEQTYQQFDTVFGAFDYLRYKQRMFKATYIATYPLSQVDAIKATVSGRMDKITYPSQDRSSLEKRGTKYDFWASLKLEYIFDNTFYLDKNLLEGTRMKTWVEGYKQIDEKKSDMLVLGLDFRHYIRIHRNFIWANRFAASTSFGNSRLMYYLGGVDNWWNFTNTPTFDNSTQMNQDINYAFQANATNLRGFSQNVRNGTSFIVMNSELRFPLFSYLANHRLKMSLFRDFQVIGFVDAGSAWNGLTPSDPQNSYNFETYTAGNMTITVHKNRAPIVWGYGFGLRTSLFGYFVRADWAWGVDDRIVLPRVFYLSLSYDF